MRNPLEIHLERDNLQQVLTIESDSITVGRGQDCEVRIDDPMASRHHCRLERLGNEVFLVDLDSRNGTWIEGDQVDRLPVTASDVIRIGSTTLRIAGGLADRLASMESTQTQQTPREQDMLQTLLAVSRTLEQEERIERSAALLVDAAVTLTRAERGFLFLLEDGRTSLALARNFAREPVPAPEAKFSRTLLEKALKTKKPILLQDAASDGEFAGVESISDLGLRSVLAVPLQYHGTVLGLLAVDHRLAAAAFQTQDTDLLAGLAGMAAAHIGAAHERVAMGKLKRKNTRLQRQLGKRTTPETSNPIETSGGPGFAGLVGTSPAMQKLYSQMERILESDASVVVEGESGTGKELVARALHFHSRLSDQNFVVENCGALPDTLLESELFGHVKGAFTGANRDRKGRFEEADGGTMFLDEIGEMSPAMQQRLLRVLQEGEIRPVGSNEVRHVNVRVIAATNVDLQNAVKEGKFREDLFYRLKVIGLRLPPLRERAEDIVILAEHFLAVEAADVGKEPRTLNPASMKGLEAYRWPGNVRELRNEMRRLTLLGEGEVEFEELSHGIQENTSQNTGDPGSCYPLADRVKAMEISAIEAALAKEPGNRSRAAKILGITRFALLRKIEKYGLFEKAEDLEEDSTD
ncbi:MAG: sigma 54-interacting transcriptional regulator [Planctomycetota bacterium]|nr:sigma 54-interacting transcriptional regulator [Planctomycetota bacterium]MDA1114084.1 sigma 54-interacting transcriptional regulator [Planctomycetota bacterium]